MDGLSGGVTDGQSDRMHGLRADTDELGGRRKTGEEPGVKGEV